MQRMMHPCFCPSRCSAPQADPSVALPGGKAARDLAEMYGHAEVVEVLDDYAEQVCAGSAV